MLRYTVLMNQSLKISLTIAGIVIALYASFIMNTESIVKNTTLQSGKTTSTSATSTTTSSSINTLIKNTPYKPSVKATPGSALVQIKYYGGPCLSGKICSTTKMITKDAVYFEDGVRIANINKNDIVKISTSMNTMNWQLLKSKPKAGCDTIRVQEITYTFYTTSGAQSISTCRHDFDISLEPFKTIQLLFPNKK